MLQDGGHKWQVEAHLAWDALSAAIKARQATLEVLAIVADVNKLAADRQVPLSVKQTQPTCHNCPAYQ